jgi:hypothetical protein
MDVYQLGTFILRSKDLKRKTGKQKQVNTSLTNLFGVICSSTGLFSMEELPFQNMEFIIEMMSNGRKK